MANERIDVTIEGDGDDLRRELRTSAAEVKAFGSEVEKQGVKARRSGQENRELQRAVGDLNRSFTAYRNAISLIKPAALITGRRPGRPVAERARGGRCMRTYRF